MHKELEGLQINPVHEKGVTSVSKFHRRPHTYVSQVDLKVTDIERSLAFYQNVIGLKVQGHTAKKAILSADGKTPLLTLEQPENVIPKQRRTTGLYHFALLLPSRQDLGKILQHFMDTRYPLQGASNHIFSEALYLADPDGNGIEIYADRPPATWPWKNGLLVAASEPLDVESVLAETNGGEWNGLPTGTVMGHLHLHGSELKHIKEFYQEGLGFDIVINIPDQALFFSTGRYHHHIAVNVWNGIGAPTPPENSVGLMKYSLVFPNEEARERVRIKLNRLGYDVQRGNGGFQTKDPSGNRIQLRL